MRDDKFHPLTLKDYIQTIGYKRVCNGSQVYTHQQISLVQGKKIIDKSTIIIRKDCPAKEAVEAIIRGDVIIKGNPAHWERIIQGWRCKNNRQESHARMLLKITSFENNVVTNKHGFSPFDNR